MGCGRGCGSRLRLFAALMDGIGKASLCPPLVPGAAWPSRHSGWVFPCQRPHWASEAASSISASAQGLPGTPASPAMPAQRVSKCPLVSPEAGSLSAESLRPARVGFRNHSVLVRFSPLLWDRVLLTVGAGGYAVCPAVHSHGLGHDPVWAVRPRPPDLGSVSNGGQRPSLIRAEGSVCAGLLS